MRLREKLLTSLLLVPVAGTSAWAKERSNYDAFLEQRDSRPLALDASSAAARGISIEQTEARLGVPTFVWANSNGSASRSVIQTQAMLRPETAARAHLQNVADAYRLTRDDVAGANLRSLHQTGQGAVVATFNQSIDGVEVFRNEVKVVMDQNLGLVAVSGYLAPTEMSLAARTSSRTGAFRLSAADAVAAAFKNSTGSEASPRAFTNTGTKGDYTFFDMDEGSTSALPQKLVSPARAKKVFFTLAGRLEPAYYVEVNAGPKASSSSTYFSYVVSASSGAVLFRNDLTAHAAAPYKYTVWADTFPPYIPYDGPQGNDATPHPTGTPNRFQAPLNLPPNVVEISNSPFSRNDPWLPANATQTTGNNVDAYADLGGGDGFQPSTDFRADVTAPNTFNYVYDTTKSPQTSREQIKASIVNLFYVTNFLHDWYYDAGFDEAAGNAQAFNYGRGGVEGDQMRAEGQDSTSRNNANMRTPADGASPRMQMYVFDGRPEVRVSAPSSIAGLYDSNSAPFGPSKFEVEGTALFAPANNALGCDAFPADTFKGKIAIITRGTCNFTAKAMNAQTAGASAVIIANNAAGDAPGLGGEEPKITIPVQSISQATAAAWKTETDKGETLSLKMRRSPDLDRDGTIDNGIIAHEWGHYISNRLVGNSAGLVNNQGRSMGEGWADFHAMLMQVKASDVTKAGNNQWQGVYSVAGYTSSGGANNGYYYGIRRIPYSTDLTKNALTFKHFANGNPLPDKQTAGTQSALGNAEVHNGGEVWATMLWECYASLLNAHPFAEAQDRMKRYIVAAYKATPNSPTLLEARDALFAVTKASDPADYQRFVAAFAKRGAGFGAIAPDRGSSDHVGVVESFEAGNNIRISDFRLDDSQVGCDQDGVLDVGETGMLHFTVTNVGASDIGSFTGVVSSTSTTAAVVFPDSGAVSIPSLARGASATVSVKVSLQAVSDSVASAGLKVDFTSAELPAASKSATYDPRINYDIVYGKSATDTFDVGFPAWTSSANYVLGRSDWTHGEEDGDGFVHGPNPEKSGEVTLTSPWVHVKDTGDFIVSFYERHSFESDYSGSGPLAPFYDGAVLELTVDGVEWYDVLDLGFNPGYTANAAIEEGNTPLSGRPGFLGANSNFPNWNASKTNFKTFLAGMDVRFRIRIAGDENSVGSGMDIDEFKFTNITGTPFAALVSEPSDGTNCNRRPVAHAGLSAGFTEGVLKDGVLTRRVITLNGTASLDPDGDALTYQWTQVGGGTPVVLTNANTATPQFVANVPADSTLMFQLVVSDGRDTSAPATVEILVVNVNQPPVAVASAPQTVDERSTTKVSLDGSASSDLDGEELEYTWEQVDDTGVAVTLTGADKAVATFTAPEVEADTQLVFRLTVSDGITEATQDVAVTVKNVDAAPNHAPTGKSPGAFTRKEGTEIVFDASNFTDPDGDEMTYHWTQVGGPVVKPTQDGAKLVFTAPEVDQDTQIAFSLVVKDSHGAASQPVLFSVSVKNDSSGCSATGGSLGGMLPILAMVAGLALSRRRKVA
ncbi:histidine kinase [Corallococcus sp. H22C18031201]|nr:histidine kinase [Corallococcus sp. H22C18031201]